MRNLNVLPEFAEVKAAILSMAEESDRLDYAVLYTSSRDGGSINITDGHDPFRYGFRIIFSATENMLLVAVKEGKSLQHFEPKRYVNKGDRESVESVLRWLTELIGHVDNGRSLTGGPRDITACN
jgi:hypothetical protein